MKGVKVCALAAVGGGARSCGPSISVTLGDTSLQHLDLWGDAGIIGTAIFGPNTLFQGTLRGDTGKIGPRADYISICPDLQILPNMLARFLFMD